MWYNDQKLTNQNNLESYRISLQKLYRYIHCYDLELRQKFQPERRRFNPMNERTNEKCRKNSLLIVMFSGFDIWRSGSICQLAIFIEKSDNLATAAPRLTLPKSLGAIFLLWNPSLSTWKRLVCGMLKLEMKGWADTDLKFAISCIASYGTTMKSRFCCRVHNLVHNLRHRVKSMKIGLLAFIRNIHNILLFTDWLHILPDVLYERQKPSPF